MEPLSKCGDRTRGQAVTDQARQFIRILDLHTEHLPPAQHFGNGLRFHSASWLFSIRHLAGSERGSAEFTVKATFAILIFAALVVHLLHFPSGGFLRLLAAFAISRGGAG